MLLSLVFFGKAWLVAFFFGFVDAVRGGIQTVQVVHSFKVVVHCASSGSKIQIKPTTLDPGFFDSVGLGRPLQANSYRLEKNRVIGSRLRPDPLFYRLSIESTSPVQSEGDSLEQ